MTPCAWVKENVESNFWKVIDIGHETVHAPSLISSFCLFLVSYATLEFK